MFAARPERVEWRLPGGAVGPRLDHPGVGVGSPAIAVRA